APELHAGARRQLAVATHGREARRDGVQQLPRLPPRAAPLTSAGRRRRTAMPGAGPFDLSGKVALITGGSRGLGREIALAFADAGADVVIASRKLDACRAAAAEVEARGRRALGVACHVGEWAQLDALVDAAYGHFGRVDVLVNNAGMSPLYPSL